MDEPAKLTSASVANDPNPANSIYLQVAEAFGGRLEQAGITIFPRTGRRAGASDHVGRQEAGLHGAPLRPQESS